MSRMYFTADLHLGHELVATHRGYETVSDHDDMIVQTLMDTVDEASTLWVLGDVTGWGHTAITRCPYWKKCSRTPQRRCTWLWATTTRAIRCTAIPRRSSTSTCESLTRCKRSPRSDTIGATFCYLIFPIRETTPKKNVSTSGDSGITGNHLCMVTPTKPVHKTQPARIRCACLGTPGISPQNYTR